MRPALSVILLTTLIGVGQGVFVALYCVELFGWTNPDNRAFFLNGAVTSLAFLAAGLIASFFHLGRPERAWRAAAMWRTSWLSREVIALPVAMVTVACYAISHYGAHIGPGGSLLSLTVGAIGVMVMVALFLCTGMIYACIRFLQEWASPLTVLNFTLLGLASGFLLATAHAAEYAPAARIPLAYSSLSLLSLSFVFKLASLWRNKRIKPKSTMQSAIGIRHSKINQQTVGFMGGSFNTREFFHGKSQWVLDVALKSSLVLTFLIPALLIVTGLAVPTHWIPMLAFAVHCLGLVIKRWHFFAQANHPQNLYYQSGT
jgi:DMSO reductase anchor subunit